MRLTRPHTRSRGSRSASRSGGSQGPVLRQRAIDPEERFGSKGPNDGFDLDDLRVEVRKVDLREQRRHQIMSD